LRVTAEQLLHWRQQQGREAEEGTMESLYDTMLRSVCSKVDSWVACGLPVTEAVQRALAASTAGPKVRAAVAARYEVAL
jgi:hypothetical protein